jgi:hypothetical protein
MLEVLFDRAITFDRVTGSLAQDIVDPNRSVFEVVPLGDQSLMLSAKPFRVFLTGVVCLDILRMPLQRNCCRS